MSQRSQFNDRYKDETEHKGVTRKGATSYKPKTKAAATVYVEPEKKTKQQRKAEQKQREKEEREKADKLARVNYQQTKGKLQSPKMKQYRTMWWIFLVIAIVATIISWLGRETLPQAVTVVTLVLAYGSIIAALYLDLGKIRKERKRLEAELLNSKTKATKAERRKAKAEEKAALEEAERQIAEEKAAKEARKQRGLFGFSKDKAVDAANEVVEKQQAAKNEKTNQNK